MQIIVADDHPMYLDAVGSMLERLYPDAAIGRAGSLDEVVAAAARLDGICSLVLLDFGMPGMEDVAAAIARVKAGFPSAHIVIVSGIATAEDVRETVAAGARGFLPKTMTMAHFGAAVALVLEGGTYLPAEIFRQAGQAAIETSRGEADMLDLLTARERQVLQHLATGKTNKEIGRELELAEITVKLHVRQILRKTNARNRSEAASIAVRSGLV